MSLFDPLYYAVSGVMWIWHRAFGALLGPASGAAWVLAVVFLVVTLRALLLRPALAQIRSAAVLRRIAPQLTALRTRHADDPARLLRETSALQKAHGISTLRTLVPAVLQLPVFLGLLHVLEGFRDPHTANYAFGPDEVSSFLDAHLFGVPLSAYVAMPQRLLDTFGVDRWAVAAVALPLMLLAAVATHLTMRRSARTAEGPGSVVMRALPWLAPLGALAGGLFFPFSIGVLLYWLTNNAWTFGQQRFGEWWVGRPAPAPARAPAVPVPAVTAAVAPTRPPAPARRRSRSRTGRRKVRR